MPKWCCRSASLAKWKTTVQLVALAIVLLERIVPGLRLPSDIVLWIAGILTLWTGLQYLIASWPHLSGELQMKILYFAWLRERLNRGEEDVTPPPSVVTVGDLIAWLAGNDEAAALAFEKRALIRSALDARLVDHDAPIAGAKVLALFPPMTGG